GRDRKDVGDAMGVLHRHRADGGRRIAAQHGHGLDVGLDARAAAGIGAGDEQHPPTRLGHVRAPAMADQTLSAWTVSLTSWTRRAAAPACAPHSAAAIEPPSRSAGSWPALSTARMKLL